VSGVSYDRIGRTYSSTRHEDPRLAAAIWHALGDARIKALATLGLPARRFVRNKVANCRTIVRRNHPDPSESTLREMNALTEATESASGLPELLGIEGNAARLYFEAFPALIRAQGGEEFGFDFTTRSRRPPKRSARAWPDRSP